MPFSHAAVSPALFAVLVVFATVVAGFAIARAAARRSRLDRRQRQRVLATWFEDYLASRVSPAELRAAAASCEAASFWTALETASVGFSRAVWWKLAGALEPCPHGAAERRALRDDSPWRRELAARRLGLLSSRRSRRALRAALERGPEPVRWIAAGALARARDAHALRWILQHPDAFAARTPRAWTALLRAFGRGAAPALEAALEAGPHDRRLERALVENLGLLRVRPAIGAIAPRLRHADPELRVAAARALGMIEAHACADALIAALADEVWPVRAQAARALGRIRAEAAVGALAGRLTDRSWWVRRHAAYALRELGPAGAAELQRAIETSADPYARDIAEEALSGGWKASA